MNEWKSPYFTEKQRAKKSFVAFYNLSMRLSTNGGWRVSPNQKIFNRSWDENGFEVSANAKIEVELIGGSTIWGWGACDYKDTVAGFLAKRAVVRTLAVPAYDFFQQALLFREFVELEGAAPKVYWFIGVNECFALTNVQGSSLSSVYNTPRLKRLNKIFGDLSTFYYGKIPLRNLIMRAIKLFIYRKVLGPVKVFKYWRCAKTEGQRQDVFKDQRHGYTYKMDLYLQKIERILLAYSHHDITFVMEPCVLTKEQLTEDEVRMAKSCSSEKTEYVEFSRKFTNLAEEHGFTVINAHDCGDSSGQNYWDYCHWSPETHRRIAKKIIDNANNL